MKQYSYRGEQQFLLEFFGGIKGYFVDIGANDGLYASNTRALAESGWKGLLVEPNPSVFASLKANYAGMDGFAFEDAAIWGVDEGAKGGVIPYGHKTIQRPEATQGPDGKEMTLLIDRGDSGRCTIFEIDGMICKENHPVKVKVMSPDELVAKHGIGDFDFLQVDAEMCDEWIVTHWPYSKAKPRLIMAEIMAENGLCERISSFLQSVGYKMVYFNNDNGAWTCRG